MKKAIFLVLILVLAFSAVMVSAHDEPTVIVNDQVSLDGTVTIEHVTSEGPGFVVIHIDNGGSPGPVIGHTAVADGENNDVVIEIDTTMATPVLYAMLHTDDNEIGVYEFGTVDGADGPVSVDGAVVTPPFNVAIISASPQFVTDSFTAANIVTNVLGWLVIHQEADGGPGPVIGATQIQAGNNANVVVELDGEVTTNLWPMIHVDTGEEGVYEFGTVEGADGPVRMGDTVATGPVSTAPSLVVYDQIVLHGDNDPSEMMEEMAPSVTITAVLSNGPGFVVVHQDADGGPGPVAGFAAVEDGLTTNLVVELDPEMVTPVLWPMLHVDDSVVGEYEFGTVEGADAPVRVGDRVVVLPINVAPSFRANPQPISEDGTITISSALIDAAGWLVIHASVDGGPGPVAGYTALSAGQNENLVIAVDTSGIDGAASDQVFPMLHYDTGEAGVYEFGSVEGADGPVRFNEAVVVGPLAIEE